MTHVSFVQNGFFQSVVGSFRNPYQAQLPADATILLVYTDPAGRIIGGDSESTGATVQPGATISFSDRLLSIAPGTEATVQASIDPDGYPIPGSGNIHWTN